MEDWARYPRFDALLTRSKKNLLRRLGRSKKSEDWNDILHELRVCASLLLEGADVDWELSPDSPDIRAVYDGFEFWIQLKFLRPYADEKVLQGLFRSLCATLQQTLESKESRLCITFQCGITVEESQIDAFSARLRAIFTEMPSFIEESLGAWEAEMAKTGELIELALPADKLVQLWITAPPGKVSKQLSIDRGAYPQISRKNALIKLDKRIGDGSAQSRPGQCNIVMACSEALNFDSYDAERWWLKLRCETWTSLPNGMVEFSIGEQPDFSVFFPNVSAVVCQFSWLSTDKTKRNVVKEIPDAQHRAPDSVLALLRRLPMWPRVPRPDA